MKGIFFVTLLVLLAGAMLVMRLIWFLRLRLTGGLAEIWDGVGGLRVANGGGTVQIGLRERG